MDIDKYRLIDIQSVWMIILLPPPWGMWSFRLAFLLTVYSHLESAFTLRVICLTLFLTAQANLPL